MFLYALWRLCVARDSDASNHRCKHGVCSWAACMYMTAVPGQGARITSPPGFLGFVSWG